MNDDMKPFPEKPISYRETNPIIGTEGNNATIPDAEDLAPNAEMTPITEKTTSYLETNPALTIELSSIPSSEEEDSIITCAIPEFPLTAFPQKVQDIVNGMVKYENYPLEFCASALLSAAGVAIGNVFRVKIKSNWKCNPALFMMFAGRPGLGKTPPIEAAYEPLKKQDLKQLQKYKTELEYFEATKKERGGDSLSEELMKPVLVQTILNDFTESAFMQAHQNNKRGIVAHQDEIMGIFKNVKGSKLVENLLSAFSGSSLKVSRKTSLLPYIINKPCLSIIGTIQVKRFQEIYDKGLDKCGLLDRFIVVFPLKQDIPLWDCSLEGPHSKDDQSDPFVQWDNVMESIISVETKFDELGEIEATEIEFSKEARLALFNWRNSNVTQLKECPQPDEVESREMKRVQITSKIALILQILK